MGGKKGKLHVLSFGLGFFFFGGGGRRDACETQWLAGTVTSWPVRPFKAHTFDLRRNE